MLRADHNGVARFGESEEDKSKLEKVLFIVKDLCNHALSEPSTLESLPSVLAEDESNGHKALEERLKALKD